MSDYGAAYKYDDAIYTTEPVKHDEKFNANMASMNEILKKARAEGLSYGQYVAKHKLALEEAKAAAVKEKPKEIRKKYVRKRCRSGVYAIIDGNKEIARCSGIWAVAEYLGIEFGSAMYHIKKGRYLDYHIKTVKRKNHTRPILQLDGQTKTILARYETEQDAANFTKIPIEYIRRAAKQGNRAMGYYWKWEDDNGDEG